MALTVREYLTADGRSPFRDWLGLLTKAVRARIQARFPGGKAVWQGEVETGTSGSRRI